MSNIATVKIAYNDEYQDLADILGVSFIEGNVYTCQVLGAYGINILESATKPTSGGFFVNAGEKFQFTAGTDTVWVKTLSERTDTYINVAGVATPKAAKGSFDKATQTLTLNNAYVVDLINQATNEQIKETNLSIIGSQDVVFDLTDVQLLPNSDMYACYGNITTQYGNATTIIDMSGGDYSVMILEGLGCVNSTGISFMGVTHEQVIQMGGVIDENAFTITGTQGNYDVTFN